MKITVRVKPNAKKIGVEKVGEEYVAFVRAPPIEGRANAELIEVLAEYFKVPKSKIRIVSGARTKKKIVEID
ncbi:MAG: DUF167 domain-containing protein [Archaeoglobaceae archaeon]|nr:DUF167 domain-containing protein [Archaeoglobales archaeon]